METTFGFSSASASSKFANFFAPRERLRQFAVGDVALADPDDFEAGNARIGQGMAHAHVAEADDENSLDHLFPPVVSRRAERRLADSTVGAGDRDCLACERHATLSIAARPSAIQFRLASL